MSLVGVNIKPEWGLYHKSIENVLDIVYKSTTGPRTKVKAEDKLPEYLLVGFPQYCEPNMYEDDENIAVSKQRKRKHGYPYQ